MLDDWPKLSGVDYNGEYGIEDGDYVVECVLMAQARIPRYLTRMLRWDWIRMAGIRVSLR